jgi:ABC-type branched-subunit amino acid transport system permease subunit
MDVEPVSEQPDAPQVGVDSWVATHAGRVQRTWLHRQLDQVPRPMFYLAFGIAAALLPAVTSDLYIVRVGFDTLLYMLLALGLNVVLGYSGLLDLGYVAFYGFGAYSYAMLASPKFGLHWDTLLILPVVIIATALLGLLVALPSRRLVGDYLAIVTLFFLQLFITVYQNGESIFGHDVTGGPNGIPNVDNWNLGGLHISSVKGYYVAALVVFLLVLACVYLVERSRTGRAWMSLREDPLAAEMMGMPVNRLKIVAFMFGAAIGGLTGTLFAALNTAVFSADFDVPTLIIVYAMLILGGAGSLGGVIIGALVVNVSLEVLRTPGHATDIFYVIVLATILVKLRPWRAVAVVLGGSLALGFALHAILESAWPRSTHGSPAIGGWLGSFLDHWSFYPSNVTMIAKVAYVLLILAVLGLTLLSGWWLWLALIPTINLAAFVWNNLLVTEPSITRLILIGVILIVLMNARPQGLLGTTRVEIV